MSRITPENLDAQSPPPYEFVMKQLYSSKQIPNNIEILLPDSMSTVSSSTSEHSSINISNYSIQLPASQQQSVQISTTNLVPLPNFAFVNPTPEVLAQYRFDQETIRLSLIRKIFWTVAVLVGFTTLISSIFYFTPQIRHIVMTNYQWAYWISYAIFPLAFIAIAISLHSMRQAPWNYVAVCMMAVTLTYMDSMITSYYAIEHLMLGFGMTFGMCVGLALFCSQRRFAFNINNAAIYAFLCLLFVLGNTCWIWGVISGWNRLLPCVYSAIGALVFIVIVIHEVEVVGPNYQLSPDEYVYGAAKIYVEVVFIFIILVKLLNFGKART